MSFREKSTAMMLLVIVLVYGQYFADIWVLAQNTSVEAIDYQLRMTIMVFVLVSLIVAGEVVIALFSPKEREQTDERDIAIEKTGDQWAGYVLGGWAIAAMALAMTEQPHFYIAHTLLAGLVLSEVSKSLLMLIQYRRGC